MDGIGFSGGFYRMSRAFVTGKSPLAGTEAIQLTI